MTVILGIDPGFRTTGFGVILEADNSYKYIASGSIKIDTEQPDAERLKQIYSGIDELVTTYEPAQAAIEQIFMFHNAGSALKLGHARGTAMVALANHNLSVHEYSAKQVKKAVVGYGAADKSQVQQMVRRLLSLSAMPGEDAADALAIAICHLHSRQSLKHLSQANKLAHGRLR